MIIFKDDLEKVSLANVRFEMDIPSLPARQLIFRLMDDVESNRAGYIESLNSEWVRQMQRWWNLPEFSLDAYKPSGAKQLHTMSSYFSPSMNAPYNLTVEEAVSAYFGFY